jgi:hypothetical protein
MNRTQKLMASVAAAAALVSSKAAQAAGSVGSAAIPIRGEQAPASDPAAAAVDAVYEKVDVAQSKALSIEEIQQRLPKMDRKAIDAALSRLVYDGRIRRIGQGTKQDPYRYYRYQGGGG